VAAGNKVTIDIESTDKAGLDKLASAYRAHGNAMGRAIADGMTQADRAVEKTETKTKQSGTKMSAAMRGAIASMTNDLNKLERGAALSGDGMSAEFAAAATEARTSLGRIADAGAKTGAGLEGDLGDALRSVRKDIDQLKPAAATVDKAFSEMARNTERLLRRIEIEAHDAGDELGDSMSRAARSMRADLERVEHQAKQTGGQLDDDIGRALKKIQADARKTRVELEDALKPPPGGWGDAVGGDSGGGFLEDMLGDFSTAKGGALAAGAAVGAALWSGLQSAWERDRVGALLAAQTGAASGQAGRLGDIAGSIFSKGFGESLDQVGEAMSAVFSLIDTSAAEGEIERITKKVITLSQTTGESANDIARATRQLLVTGMAQNMSAAMDMIQTAAEKGLNVSGDLLETINEYSTQFRSLGINGQQAFGLIGQAVKGGARDVDIAADALKEFSIRAKDGSVLTKSGFEAIGLNAETMGHRVAAGGASAKSALQETLNALNAMPPGVERNTAAVALFGTQAEDLGNALFEMDLDTASEQFGAFGGSVEKAMQKISNSQTGVDKFNRTMEDAKAGVGNFLDSILSSDALDEMTGKTQLLKQAMEEFISTGDSGSLDALKDKFPEMSQMIDDFIEANGGAKESMDAGAESAEDYAGSLQTLIDKKKELAGEVLSLRDAEREWQASIDDAAEAIKDNGRTLDINTEKGRANQDQLDGLAEQALDTADAMAKNSTSVQQVDRFLERAGGEFVRTAGKMGMAKDEAVRLAIRLGLIPNNVSTRMTLLGMSYAQARAEQFRNMIYSIPSTKYVHLRVSAQGSGHYFAEQESGGITGARPIGQAQTGGARNGPTTLNEAGPEIATLPSGTKVATAGATRSMLESGLVSFGGGGGSPVPTKVVELRSDGSVLSDWMLKTLREAVRDEGGNVQLVLGSR
jgi:phage-related minor tail protein